MSTTLRMARGRQVLGGLLDRLGAIVLVLTMGWLLGTQYFTPNKRVIAVSVAVVLFGITWWSGTAVGLGVMLLALPYPRVTVFGNTNLAFALFLLILWLLRVSQRRAPRPHSTPVDAPLLALFIAYVVSFYNVEARDLLRYALPIFEGFVGGMLVFVLITRNLHSEEDFRRLLSFQAVSVLTVGLLAIFELTHPNQQFIPGWIQFGTGGGAIEEIQIKGMRVGSAFFDYELLSEFCALNGLLVAFMLLRAKSLIGRVVFGGLLVLDVFVLFATVTRGALIALAIGLGYLLWIVRRRLNFVMLVTTIAIVVALFGGMDFYVGHFTRSASVSARFTQERQFVGIVPADRLESWTHAFERMLEHPFIGHGPYYSARTGLRLWTWPHCLYLLVGNNVGFIGLGIFLWMLWTLFRLSRPPTDDLRRGPYLQSYLIIARVQMVVFLIDEIKIEFLRNANYQFQIWVMFALLVAAQQVDRAMRQNAAMAAAPVRIRP